MTIPAKPLADGVGCETSSETMTDVDSYHSRPIAALTPHLDASEQKPSFVTGVSPWPKHGASPLASPVRSRLAQLLLGEVDQVGAVLGLGHLAADLKHLFG